MTQNDNSVQLRIICRYQRHLERMLNKDIDLNFAAVIWIRKYAHLWRLRHPSGEFHV